MSWGRRRRRPGAKAALLASVAALACDFDFSGGEGTKVYVADPAAGEATIHLMRLTEGHELRAKEFQLVYLARGEVPLCGCVEVDAGAFDGAPPGLLQDAADLGTRELEPGSGATARICASAFEAADEDGVARGQGRFELGARKVEVEVFVSLEADEDGEGHRVDVRAELPMSAFGVSRDVLDAEMLDAGVVLDYAGKSRESRDLGDGPASKICAPHM